jgi:hypothetical protein
LGSIIAFGVVPSCWLDGDVCGVCGRDRLEDFRSHQGDWILEIESPALEGAIKAWWVPPEAIRGAWHDGRFHEIGELREMFDSPEAEPTCDGCACPLHPLVHEQIELWRRARSGGSNRAPLE